MLDIINKLFNKKSHQHDDEFSEDDSGLTIIKQESDPHNERMVLEERKKWRAAMVQSAMKDVFYRHGVGGNMYKYKVIPVDDRHHCFVLIIEILRHFQPNEVTSSLKLIRLEKSLKREAFHNYGVTVHGVFWKAIDGAEIVTPVSIKSNEIKIPKEDAMDKESDLWVSDNEEYDASEFFEQIPEEETKAFREAIRRGAKLPPLNFGQKEYSTDLAPLN
jgi:hypothetical protein